jgi:hypothetical protein
MTSGLALFDPYNRQARLYPALVALLPPLVAVLAWFPTLLTSNIGSTLATLAGSCGLLYALSVFSRSCGKRTEARLLRDWGGWPTTQWLRHSDPHLPAFTKQRYHQALARAIPLAMPTLAQEQSSPGAADETYQSAVEWLKERARGPQFPLVLKENIEYGFRRNMRGIRPFAIAATAIALIGSLSGIAYLTAHSALPWPTAIEENVAATVVGATALLLVALLAWILFVKDGWVRQAGDQYARALLATCESI